MKKIIKNESHLGKIGKIFPVKINFKDCINFGCKYLVECTKIPLKIKCKMLSEAPVYISYPKGGLIFNLTPSLFKAALLAHIFGSTTPILKVSYTGLSSYYDDDHELITTNERARAAVTDSTVLGNLGSCETYFGLTDAITAQSEIATISSTTVFTVDDITGFEINDRIQIHNVTNGLKDERKIQDIDVPTDEITLDRASNLLEVNGEIDQLHNLVFLLADTSDLQYDGLPVSVAKLGITKDATEVLLFLHNILIV